MNKRIFRIEMIKIDADPCDINVDKYIIAMMASTYEGAVQKALSAHPDKKVWQR